MDRNEHSRLALKEAKAMARSRQKRKTSRIICHHLLLMLEEDPTPGDYLQRPNRTVDDNKYKQYSLFF